MESTISGESVALNGMKKVSSRLSFLYRQYLQLYPQLIVLVLLGYPISRKNEETATGCTK